MEMQKEKDERRSVIVVKEQLQREYDKLLAIKEEMETQLYLQGNGK